jgi:hypothetical protein
VALALSIDHGREVPRAAASWTDSDATPSCGARRGHLLSAAVAVGVEGDFPAGNSVIGSNRSDTTKRLTECGQNLQSCETLEAFQLRRARDEDASNGNEAPRLRRKDARVSLLL